MNHWNHHLISTKVIYDVFSKAKMVFSLTPGAIMG